MCATRVITHPFFLFYATPPNVPQHASAISLLCNPSQYTPACQCKPLRTVIGELFWNSASVRVAYPASAPRGSDHQRVIFSWPTQPGCDQRTRVSIGRLHPGVRVVCGSEAVAALARTHYCGARQSHACIPDRRARALRHRHQQQH